MADHPRDRFLEVLGASLQSDAFVKLTLGAPCGPDGTLRNVRARVVSLRSGLHLQLVARHDTQDLTRNVALADAVQEVEGLLGSSFHSAHLFTTERAWQLEHKRKGWRLTRGKATAQAPDRTHDRRKQRVLDLDPRWMSALGVLDGRGRVRRGMAAKETQIRRFVALLAPVLERLGPRERIRVVDMGCGKGFLTFATWQLITSRGIVAEVTGVEQRPALVQTSEGIARSLGLEGLHFVAGSIDTAPLEDVDVVIALHACDTATDDALARGVAANAEVLLVAPCCHQEVRPQLAAPDGQEPLLHHGILRTRQADLVTDALRAALLDAVGYRARVFEFVRAEHTDKNLMIAAERAPGSPDAALARAAGLARTYGIATQRLADRLNISLTPAD